MIVELFVLCRMHGKICEETYLNLLNAIKRARQLKKPILVHINSYGGEIDWASKIRALLFQCKNEGIDVYAFGHEKVYSAALTIFLSCFIRVGAPAKTNFFIHLPEVSTEESDEKVLKFQNDIFEFYAQVTNLSADEYYALAKDETYFGYHFALQKGIVNFDHIEGCIVKKTA
jgi:ATP-dependent protease ClpP protease subunit